MPSISHIHSISLSPLLLSSAATALGTIVTGVGVGGMGAAPTNEAVSTRNRAN